MANSKGDPFRGTLGHLKIDLKSELDFEHFVAKPKGNPFDLQIEPKIDLKIDLKIDPLSTPGNPTESPWERCLFIGTKDVEE